MIAVTAAFSGPLAGCAGRPGPAAPPARTWPAAPAGEARQPASSGTFAERLLALLDDERARVGLAPLQVAKCARGPAERWASQIAAGESLRHQTLGPIVGSCRARRAGEIVGSTTRSPESLVRAWMNSPKHRGTLLNSAFTHVGLGAERARSGRWFAVADFVAF